MQTKKEEVKQRIAQELAIANAQTLINVSSKALLDLAAGILM